MQSSRKAGGVLLMGQGDVKDSRGPPTSDYPAAQVRG